MQKIIHRASERGFADHGWLKSFHSFSFASYYDPHKTHFGLLRVLNDDTVAPGMGFGAHPHENMEIISIPLSGALEHKDSTGNETIITAGEIQIMSAGSGLSHSEYNHSKTEEVKFLQIWIFPKEKNIKPRYDQKKFYESDMLNKFKTIVSEDGKDDSIIINQDATLSMGYFIEEANIEYSIKDNKGVYFFILTGNMVIDDIKLSDRDAVGITFTSSVRLKINANSKILAIEVPLN